jgi:tRNA threonylcarbamoyladenosine biosynthesis protein TsaB
VLGHQDRTDYSEWLIPAVEGVLRRSEIKMGSVDLYAVATGPGSFTGVRVGITTVKAWCEVYGKPVVGVSRLEALAAIADPEPPRGQVDRGGSPGLLAAFYDAQRGQVFGALYRSKGGSFVSVGDEMVIAPEAFLELATQEAGEDPIEWVCLDPELITGLAAWGERVKRGDVIREASPELATKIGQIAEQRANAGKFSDLLELDANYVRRSDAEIFWKGPAANVR